MSHIEKAIQASKRYESSLEKSFGATGKGLHEKLESVSNRIPEDIQRMLKFIATVRNKLVHDENYNEIDDIDRFNQCCDKLNQFFTKKQFNGAVQSEPKPDPIYSKMEDTALYYREYDFAKKFLRKEITVKEFIYKWEIMSKKHFEFNKKTTDTILLWLSGMILHELRNKPMHLYHNMKEVYALFPHFGINDNLFHKPLDKVARRPCWGMQQYEQYINYLFKNKKNIGLRNIQFGVGYNGDEVIRLFFELPYIDVALFGGGRYKTTQFKLDLVYESFTENTYHLPVDYQTFFNNDKTDIRFKTKSGKTLRVTQQIDPQNPVCRLKGAGDRNTDIFIKFFVDNRILRVNDVDLLDTPLTMNDFMNTKVERSLLLFDNHDYIGEKTFRFYTRHDDGVPIIASNYDSMIIPGIKDEPVHLHFVQTSCVK